MEMSFWHCDHHIYSFYELEIVAAVTIVDQAKLMGSTSKFWKHTGGLFHTKNFKQTSGVGQGKFRIRNIWMEETKKDFYFFCSSEISQTKTIHIFVFVRRLTASRNSIRGWFSATLNKFSMLRDLQLGPVQFSHLSKGLLQSHNQHLSPTQKNKLFFWIKMAGHMVAGYTRMAGEKQKLLGRIISTACRSFFQE